MAENGDILNWRRQCSAGQASATRRASSTTRFAGTSPSNGQPNAAEIKALPGMPLRAHFHNTRNTGIANAYAAVAAGVAALDASIGGIGGCPFAPGATGNIPTEDLVYMLGRMGVETAVDLEALITTGRWLQNLLGRPLPGLLIKAGSFPRPMAT